MLEMLKQADGGPDQLELFCLREFAVQKGRPINGTRTCVSNIILTLRRISIIRTLKFYIKVSRPP